MSSDKCIHLHMLPHNSCPQSRYKTFSSLQKAPSCPSQSTCAPPPTPGNHVSDSFHHSVVYYRISQKLYQMVCILLCLASFPQHGHDVFEVIHVFASVFHSFYCLQYVCIYHNLFIHFPTVDIWVNFSLSHYKFAMNSPVQVLLWTYVLLSLRDILRSATSGSKCTHHTVL